jgi:hypothetical protein
MMTLEEIFEAVMELIERTRRIESFFLGGGAVILQDIKNRATSFFDTLIARYDGRLPFGGKYLKAFRDSVMKNIEQMQAQWKDFAEGGDFDAFVDFLTLFARGNLQVAWYLKPFSGIFLDGVGRWMKQNRKEFADKIGHLPSPAVPAINK